MWDWYYGSSKFTVFMGGTELPSSVECASCFSFHMLQVGVVVLYCFKYGIFFNQRVPHSFLSFEYKKCNISPYHTNVYFSRLFVLFSHYLVCSCMHILYLISAAHRWTCLYCILLHILVHWIMFWRNVLLDLYNARDNLCILLHI